MDRIFYKSPEWEEMQAYLELRLDELRRRNDGDQTDISTAQVRGRIAEIKKILQDAKSTLETDKQSA